MEKAKRTLSLKQRLEGDVYAFECINRLCNTTVKEYFAGYEKECKEFLGHAINKRNEIKADTKLCEMGRLFCNRNNNYSQSLMRYYKLLFVPVTNSNYRYKDFTCGIGSYIMAFDAIETGKKEREKELKWIENKDKMSINRFVKYLYDNLDVDSDITFLRDMAMDIFYNLYLYSKLMEDNPFDKENPFRKDRI